ncbi:MAG: aspartate-semialdehyde dehydrogenase [Chitinispirillaceae bacterium]|nr:aspartate-semialdehyde dehydrogenase [Chitinispirillaceae bacterium]
MADKVPVGILGATGMVGQQYVRLLKNHPWFSIAYLAASPKSAGKPYEEAVDGRWHLEDDIPERIRSMPVGVASDVSAAAARCRLVFSAVEMEKSVIAALEEQYAAQGLAVVSNNSAHRWTKDVPMLLPEINHEHLSCISQQRKNRGWEKGLIVVKSNCSIQSYMTPLYALKKAGYVVDRMFVATLQAVSGAGYPGPSSFDMIDNVIPFIGGEEEKSECEPLKILGSVKEGGIDNAALPSITAHCNRVPVVHGHTACVSLGFSGEKPSLSEIEHIWNTFRSEPQELSLPSAPDRPIAYRHERNRPQPRFDRDVDKGMRVTVGRLRHCSLLDIRFVGLHHNTVRGAAGGCVLTAELLKAEGWID